MLFPSIISNSKYFCGYVDHLRLFNRVLTEEEIVSESFEGNVLDYDFLVDTSNNPLKNIRRDIKKDSKGKILILNEKVTNCVFIPVDDYWNIKVKLEGAYADKR